jgi:hypothetical protein
MTSTTDQTNNPNSWTSFTSSQGKKSETPTHTNIDEINKILGYVSDEVGFDDLACMIDTSRVAVSI